MKNLNVIIIVFAMAWATPPAFGQKRNQAGARRDTVTLPQPHATKSKTNFSKVQGWKSGRLPDAPQGMIVNRFADGFENPRWTYVTPNGDILVAESNGNHTFWEKVAAPIVGASKSNNLHHSADRITILRDANHDGTPEMRQQFLGGLNQPFGMLILKDWFYVANTDGLWRFPYKEGAVGITGKGEKILDLPAGKHNRHWTRNIIANKNGTKIYIAVGSGSNIAEHGMLNEILRADILEIDLDGANMRIYASGLRNPVGMGFAPGTNTLWTVVNERDELGDDLVPDYLTSVQEEGFYGWPYTYYGEHVDARVKDRPATARNAIIPDVALGSHTASLGLAFCTNKTFPEKYQNGAFIAQHGSWNRSTLAGYKV
ncbi:MAG TPA: sorbosone dehydrogenase family protein, partial [Chryseolinea sp.]|nr:sorbosone dehydrogenase family protein [Chryseolinea sp.]